MNAARLYLGLCLLTAACSGTATDAEDTPGEAAAAGTFSVANGGSSAGAPLVSEGGASPVGGAGAGGTAGSGANEAGGGSGGFIATAGASSGGADSGGGGANAGGAGAGGSSSGGSSMGGRSGTSGSGGASTGFDIDYSIWQLQLPSGTGTSPDIIPPSKLEGYRDAYFYPAADHGQIFMDPPTGIHTSGSVHPRSEMRESKPDNSQVLWKPSATNTMTVVGKAIKCSSCTIAQIFNGTHAITLAELQYSSSNGGSMKLFYEEAKGEGLAPVDLGVTIPLDTQYTFVMSLTKNVLSVTVNGKVRYTKTPSAAMLASQFYFKVGNYDQTSTGGPVVATVHSQIEVYSVAVAHE